MDQISPPMRIVLVVAVLFGAAYFTVLKPKDEAAAPVAAETVPAVEAGGRRGQHRARQCRRAGQRGRRRQRRRHPGRFRRDRHGRDPARQPAGHDPGRARVVRTPSLPRRPSRPSTSPSKDLPKWLATSMDKQVIAVLFTNASSADDRRTSNNLQHAYDYDGDVLTRVVNVKKISALPGDRRGRRRLPVARRSWSSPATARPPCCPASRAATRSTRRSSTRRSSRTTR